MKTTVTLDEKDIAEAVGLFLEKRGMSATATVSFNVDDSDVGDPRGGRRVVTVSIEAKPFARPLTQQDRDR